MKHLIVIAAILGMLALGMFFGATTEANAIQRCSTSAQCGVGYRCVLGACVRIPDDPSPPSDMTTAQ
jgi:hypothetical protein